MIINLYTFGKIKSSEEANLYEYYIKLASKYAQVKKVVLKSVEERKIKLSDMPDSFESNYSVVLTEKGLNLSTEELIEKFRKFSSEGIHINIFLGNSFGFEQEVIDKAKFKLSLSKLTMPHELALVIFCEQLFRVLNSLNGGKYNK